MNETVRLHLGCGDKRWPGFVNVDANPDPVMGEPDLKCDVTVLDVPTESVSEIHSIHLFEHIHRSKINAALKEWHRALIHGGKLVMEMPSLDKIVAMLAAGEKNMRLTLLGIFGDPRDPKPDMLHQWCWSNGELVEVLDQAGFEQIVFAEPKFHIAKRDLRVECVKP